LQKPFHEKNQTRKASKYTGNQRDKMKPTLKTHYNYGRKVWVKKHTPCADGAVNMLFMYKREDVLHADLEKQVKSGITTGRKTNRNIFF